MTTQHWSASKSCATIAALVAVSACTTTDAWTGRGSSNEQAQRDQAECRQAAEQFVHEPGRKVIWPLSRQVVADRTRECMTAKGYQPIEPR